VHDAIAFIRGKRLHAFPAPRLWEFLVEAESREDMNTDARECTELQAKTRLTAISYS